MTHVRRTLPQFLRLLALATLVAQGESGDVRLPERPADGG